MVNQQEWREEKGDRGCERGMGGSKLCASNP